MAYFKNKTILVPYDFSEPAKHALETALELADESTSLHAIHVVAPTPTMISFDPALPIPPSFDQDRYQQTSAQLEKVFGDGQFERFKSHCEIGDPGSEVVELAKKIRADLIVMPSHGRKGLTRLLLGSVAERVLRLAQCPVLVLRGKDFNEA